MKNRIIHSISILALFFINISNIYADGENIGIVTYIGDTVKFIGLSKEGSEKLISIPSLNAETKLTDFILGKFKNLNKYSVKLINNNELTLSDLTIDLERTPTEYVDQALISNIVGKAKAFHMDYLVVIQSGKRGYPTAPNGGGMILLESHGFFKPGTDYSNGLIGALISSSLSESSPTYSYFVTTSHLFDINKSKYITSETTYATSKFQPSEHTINLFFDLTSKDPGQLKSNDITMLAGALSISQLHASQKILEYVDFEIGRYKNGYYNEEEEDI